MSIVVCECGYVKTPNPSRLMREEVKLYGGPFPPEGLVVRERHFCEKCLPARYGGGGA